MKTAFRVDVAVRDFSGDSKVTYYPPEFIVEVDTPRVVGETNKQFQARQSQDIVTKVRRILNTSSNPLVQIVLNGSEKVRING